MTNEAFIAALRNGNEAAFRHLYNSHHKQLCYFANQLLSNEEAALDVVADTFIKVFEKKEDFHNYEALKAFLFVVTRNECIAHFRHQKMKERNHQEILYLLEKDENFVESKLIKTELVNKIRMEVDRLPPQMRRIFKMIYFDGLTQKETASLLNISVDTVRVLKARALAELSRIFSRDKMLWAAFMILVMEYKMSEAL